MTNILLSLRQISEPAVHRRLRTIVAVIGAMALALPLSACGRKGALDPPPGGYSLQSGSGRTPVSCMNSTWRTSQVSTSSTQWTAVPGFSSHPASIFPIAVNVSALVSGAPVQFRILRPET